MYAPKDLAKMFPRIAPEQVEKARHGGVFEIHPANLYKVHELPRGDELVARILLRRHYPYREYSAS